MSFNELKARWDSIFSIYPWHFIGFLIMAMLIPKFYELTNTFWIGRISFDALAITEQYEFISVTIEIVNETIPFGVLALVAQNYKNNDKIISILKTGLIVQILFSLIITGIIILFSNQLVSTIGTPATIVDATTKYLILKAIALPFESIAFILLITIKSMQKGKEALLIVFFSVILNMVLDLFLISNLSFSLHLGIQGIAIGYVISKVTLMMISFLLTLHLLKVDLKSFFTTGWQNYLKPLFRIGSWTGLDSLVRNVGYMGLLLVLNLLGTNEYGGYGLAMTVMWTFIIPVLALGEGTSVVVGNLFGEHKYKELLTTVKTSLALILVVMGTIAIIGILWWDDISAFFNPNPEMIRYSTETFWWLILPYIGFGVGTALRSVFYGTGETRYIFYIACAVNIGMILPFILMVRFGIIQATFTTVMMFYCVSFLTDPILAYIGVKKVEMRRLKDYKLMLIPIKTV